VSYFHGGAAGLRVGQRILPPSVTGAKGSSTLHGFGSEGRKDMVYLTECLSDARMFAACHPSRRGCVYEVTPESAVFEDPDCFEGTSVYCASAVVVRVIPMSSSARNRAVRRMLRQVSQ